MIRLVAMAMGVGFAAIAAKILETEKEAPILDEPANMENDGEMKDENAYQRGDRFFCPDTGIELQVRAVGGRPRKNEV